MKLAFITLSDEGLELIRKISSEIPDAAVFAHDSTTAPEGVVKFNSVIELTRKIFSEYAGLVYICPCGVAVRALGENIGHKTTDPAVAVIDVGSRYVVSLLSGHEGGANKLAVDLANILDAEPVITTTTEALKKLIVGVGCKRETKAEQIQSAIREALRRTGFSLADVRLIASADLKRHETGLLKAARRFSIPIRFISSDEIRNCQRFFSSSEFVNEKVNLPAVAEPAALLAGSRTKLILSKTIINQITVAIARENCTW